MSGAENHARLLNQWADALEELPSGPFASEDIRAAADALTTAEARIQELEAALMPFVKMSEGELDTLVISTGHRDFRRARRTLRGE